MKYLVAGQRATRRGGAGLSPYSLPTAAWGRNLGRQATHIFVLDLPNNLSKAVLYTEKALNICKRLHLEVSKGSFRNRYRDALCALCLL